MAKKLITIEDDLYKELRLYAFNRNISAQKVISDAIKSYFGKLVSEGIEKQEQEVVTDADDGF